MPRRGLGLALAGALTAVALSPALALPAVAAPPAYAVVRQITMPQVGAGVAVDPSRGLVYVAARNADQVLVYDESTLALEATIPVPDQPLNLAVGADGYVYVSQYTGTATQGSMAVISPASMSVVDTVPVGLAPVGVTVSTAGDLIFVANLSSPFVSVLDAANPAAPVPLTTIALPGGSETVTENAAGTALYVATDNPSVYVVDISAGVQAAAVTHTWSIVGYTHQVMLSADEQSAFVSAQLSTATPVFDTASNTQSGSIPVAGAYYQSADPGLGVVFMTVPYPSSGTGYVVAVDQSTGAVLQTLPNITAAYYPATDPVTHNTFVTSISGTALTEIAPLASPPVVTVNPADQTVGEGSAASFTSAATGTTPISVQWQASTDGGATWANISGATSDTYTVDPATLADSGDRYRAVFTNTAGSATTTPATLTVDPLAPVVTGNPADLTVTEGTAATFAASATSSTPATVHWQSSTDGGSTWTDLNGAGSDTLSIAPATVADSGTRYRAVFTNVAGTSVTTAATLTVTPLPPTVTADPADQTVTEESTATFTAAATSSVPETVRWQVSTDQGASWSEIPGAESDTYTIPSAALTDSGRQYRAIFTNRSGSATTSPGILTVTPTSTVPTPPPSTPPTPPPGTTPPPGATPPTGGAAVSTGGTRAPTGPSTAFWVSLAALVTGSALLIGLRRRRRP